MESLEEEPDMMGRVRGIVYIIEVGNRQCVVVRHVERNLLSPCQAVRKREAELVWGFIRHHFCRLGVWAPFFRLSLTPGHVTDPGGKRMLGGCWGSLWGSFDVA